MAKRTCKVQKEKPAPTMWELNQDVFDAVLNELGIVHKVKVIRTSRVGRHGHFQPKFKGDEVVFHICINKYLSHEAAVMTLLHELQHAVQYEYVTTGCTDHWERNEAWGNLCRSQGKKYWDRPIEVEARRAAWKYKEYMGIVIPGTECHDVLWHKYYEEMEEFTGDSGQG